MLWRVWLFNFFKVFYFICICLFDFLDKINEFKGLEMFII